ncbi:MAG: ATPase [Thalassobaculales bacterium]
MKRFYREAVAADGRILLDGRPVRTPLKAVLAVPAPPLAAAIAAEWQAQGDQVDPRSMPLTRVAATAIDRVAPQRAHAEAETLRFGASDLLCYRAEAPADLAAAQHAAWQPLLDWAAVQLDAALVVTSGLMPADQPEGAMTALAAAVRAHDDFALAGLHALAAGLGSLVLALAVSHGRLDAGAAFAAAQIDEEHQASRWGRDGEMEARRRALAADIADAARFLSLLRG